MKTIIAFSLFLLLLQTPLAIGQTSTVIWQVNSFDINVNVQQEQRLIAVAATLNATNVGNGQGRTLTVRLNSKVSMKSVAVAGAPATFRQGAEAKPDLQKFEISLPSTVAPKGNTSVTVNYTFPVESNSGLAAISPIGTEFLPDSFWFPMPNTPFTIRGADTAPYRISVNLPNAVAGGTEKTGQAGSISFDQSLHGQPFFVQGDWDRIEGSGDNKGVIVLAPKGANAVERKGAETLISFAGAARTFFSTSLGPAPDVPIRLVAVRRGTGFSDGGTLLFDADALRLPRIDAATALAVSETVARLWIGGRVAVRGEGSGVLKDGLVRYLATLFIEKQFGREAVQSELYRERIAYTTVAQRDAPLAVTNQMDSTYYNSVPNRGAMVWRLIDRSLGRDVLLSFLRDFATNNPNGVTLASVRSALNEKGGESLKAQLDQQLDQVVDTDLLVGLPQQRGAEWVSALRNLGSVDVNVPVVATTDRGEVITVQATIPAKNFSEVAFKTTSKIVRVEVDPGKLYPQTSYGNDVVPHTKDLNDALNDISSQLGAQDFAKAEVSARELLAAAPRLQEARILLARALLGANKLDEAEKLFQASLNEPLPFTATLAWANIGLGEISMKRNQPAEAAKRFNEAIIASRDFPSSLAAHAARIRAEAAANTAPPIDESARTFVTQFGQAVLTNKRADLESRVVPGELVKFINATIGTDVWETRVVRTEELSGGLLVADVTVRLRKLGTEGNGTAVFLLSRVGGAWKLSGIDLFDVK